MNDVPRGWATCPRCDQRMTPGTSCDASVWRQDGRVIPPIAYGAEIPEYPGEFCRDCNTPRGGTHHYDCDIERCPHMKQATTCDLCPVLENDPFYRPPRVD